MDDLTIGDGWGLDGVLDDACETVADRLGGSPVEAKDVLVEIALHMFGADRTVMGAEQPAFGEPEDEVDGGQVQDGITAASVELHGGCNLWLEGRCSHAIRRW